MDKRIAILIENILHIEQVKPSVELTHKFLKIIEALSIYDCKIFSMRHGFPPYTKQHTLKEISLEFERSSTYISDKIRKTEKKLYAAFHYPRFKYQSLCMELNDFISQQTKSLKDIPCVGGYL